MLLCDIALINNMYLNKCQVPSIYECKIQLYWHLNVHKHSDSTFKKAFKLIYDIHIIINIFQILLFLLVITHYPWIENLKFNKNLQMNNN